MMLDDETIAQLFETLVWQSGEDLDYRGFDRSDIDPGQQELLIERFRAFMETNSVDIDAYMAHTGRTMTDVAHDYILTANRHGTGFWDRCYCGIDQSDEPAKRLSNMARLDGEIDLYVGDDGSLDLAL